MRLKCIRLAGFKSFVDPATVSFPSSMTAVVGPNGCGKSNIIDAVRWVLGESSAKNLRGEAMTDVIFNGSNSRKPVSQASIELVFDNSDGSLTGEYASYAEISIRRKVTREGQSSYYLNGTKCRRRDITGIFLGTGLGPRSYAIIEQGMISRLVEARPDDLRIFIEEAAGISKYKERRRETENRLQRTRDNLARLTDLREELGRQLERLQRQAQAAQRYQQLRQQQEQYQHQLTAMRWQLLQEQGDELEQLLGGQENALQAHISNQYQAEARIEQLRDRQHDLNEAFNRVQARFYAVGADIARTEQSIQHARQRVRQLQEDLRESERQQQEVQAHLAQDQALLDELGERRLLLQEECEQATEQDEICQAALMQADEQQQEWQEQWQRFSAASSAPRQQVEVERLRGRQLQQSLHQLEQRVAVLEQEREQLSATLHGEEDRDLEEQRALLEEQLAVAQLQQEEQREQQLHWQERMRSLQGEQHEAQTRQQRCQGQISALQALQQDALQADSGVQEWLEQQRLHGCPPLADGLRVEAGWEAAVELVLGADVRALCVEQWPTGFSALQEASLRLVRDSGQAGGEQAQEAAKCHGSLLEKVLASPVNLAPWLGRVCCAGDLAEAMQLLHDLPDDASVVSRDGFWLGRQFLRVQQGADSQRGVLQRAQQLEQLQEQERLLGAELHENGRALAEAQSVLDGLEQQQRLVRQQEQQHTAGLSEVKSRLAAARARSEQIERRSVQIVQQLDELREQQAMEQEMLAESALVLEQAELAVADVQDRAQQLEQRQADVRAAYEQARRQAQASRDRVQQLRLQLGTVTTQQQSALQALERLRVQLERGRQRQQQLGLDLQEGTLPTDELEARLEEQLQQRAQIDEELRGARMALEDADHQLRELEKQGQQARQQAEQIREQAEKLRLNRHALQVQKQTLVEQLDAAGQSLDELLVQLPGDAEPQGWQAQLEQLEVAIQRLGAINLAAIEEYRQQSARKLYLDEQNDDLQEALATLENVIRKIDNETRQRFKETFDRINAGLQELFPKVFGGGMASLELTGDNLMDTGVAIMARPPGKKNSTIHLLSGGEKALTALALVFAIFQLNPAPFCMLDEVDAPLDDANVSRYARLVKEMSGQVQFIYITHNKIAMEMAEQLLGVTMQEPGCSRMVAVDLAEAAAMAQQ